MGAGKALGIAEGIITFPHRLARQRGPGVQRTAARHLIVVPFRSNMDEILAEGLRVDAVRNSSICRLLGLSEELAAELGEHVYILPPTFDPINNAEHARDFANAWVVLCTDAMAARACANGMFEPTDFIAIWFDEADIGNDASDSAAQRKASLAAAWLTVQNTLCNSWLFLFSGTLAEWMRRDIIPNDGLLVRCTYGDLFRSFGVCQLVVTTLCASGMVIDGETIGDGPLSEAQAQLLRTSPQAREHYYMLTARTVLDRREADGVPHQAIIFENLVGRTHSAAGRRTPIEECFEQMVRIVGQLRECSITGVRLRIAFAYSGTISDANRGFRDTEFVLREFKDHQYDILIVAKIGTRGLNNPLLNIGLNMRRHLRTIASRNEQMQADGRLGRHLRTADPWLRRICERYDCWDAVESYIARYSGRGLHQRATIFELDANFENNHANQVDWAREQDAEASIVPTSARLIELVPEAAQRGGSSSGGGSSGDNGGDDNSDDDDDDGAAEAQRESEQARRAAAEQARLQAAAARARKMVARAARIQQLERERIAAEDRMREAFEMQPGVEAFFSGAQHMLAISFEALPGRPGYELLGFSPATRRPRTLMRSESGIARFVLLYTNAAQIQHVAVRSGGVTSQRRALNHVALRRVFGIRLTPPTSPSSSSPPSSPSPDPSPDPPSPNPPSPGPPSPEPDPLLGPAPGPVPVPVTPPPRPTRSTPETVSLVNLVGRVIHDEQLADAQRVEVLRLFGSAEATGQPAPLDALDVPPFVALAGLQRARQAAQLVLAGCTSQNLRCPVCLSVPERGEIRLTRCCVGVMCHACIVDCCNPPLGQRSGCPMCRRRFEQIAAVAAPTSLPLAAPPASNLARLLARLATIASHPDLRRRTFSLVYVPLVHAILQSDAAAAGEYAADAAAWASHDPAWVLLVAEYRAFLLGSPHTAVVGVLVPGAVQQRNAAAQAPNAPSWPYIEASPPDEAPENPMLEAWPLESAGLGVTQEGILGQSPELFARLMEMVRRWLVAIQPAPAPEPAPPPAPAPSDGLPTPPPLPEAALEDIPLEPVYHTLVQSEAGAMELELDHDHSSDCPVARDIMRRASGRRDVATYDLVAAALEPLGRGVDHYVTDVAAMIVAADDELESRYRRAPGGAVRAIHRRIMNLARWNGDWHPTTYRELRFDYDSAFCDRLLVRLIQSEE
mmetsp:Transcript_12333/g.39194  ORF Transcript_12333/g.39194 Transcript_12333/m.39194 type:complete len:1191 (+) Transcript_12333:346-3918(+)